MKRTSKWIERAGEKHIHENYEFMLDRGYEIFSVEDAFMGWQVTLRKADLFVRILWTREEEYVLFGTGPQPPDQFVDMEIVMTAITGEKLPVSWKSHAQDLQKHLDQIERYFAGEYVKNPAGLQIAVQEYNASLPNAEQFASEEPFVPQEPKRIPILYYPLMGIILLLLFGALATLYMVLLDRLFAAFSLESEEYGIIMGAGAILLSIGTLVIFRGRRQKG